MNTRRNRYRIEVMTQNPGYSLALATQVAADADTAHTAVERAVFLGNYSRMAQLHAEIQDSPSIRNLVASPVRDLCKELGW